MREILLTRLNDLTRLRVSLLTRLNDLTRLRVN